MSKSDIRQVSNQSLLQKKTGNSIYYLYYFVFVWLENTTSHAKTCSCNYKF